MTIMTNIINIEFDPSPELENFDKAQPITVKGYEDFVILEQWDGNADDHHCILVERRDVQALVDALLGS